MSANRDDTNISGKRYREPGNDVGAVWLPRSAVTAAINPHLLSLLKIESQHQVIRVNAPALLSPSRLDVMAKYIYAYQAMRGGSKNWADHVYCEHLKVWNQFQEKDGSGKCSFEDYRESFDGLLSSFRENGFDERRGMVPVGGDDVIIDGSHRLAAALAVNCAVRAVRFNVTAKTYDYQYFRARGLGEEILDDMVLQYCRLDGRVRVAVLFPVAQGRDQQVVDLLRDCGPIVHRKDVFIGRGGRANFVRLLYRDEPWLGDEGKLTPGTLRHMNDRFLDHVPVKLLFFIGKDHDAVRSVKERIRSLFGLGNNSVHINDVHSQTVAIAESVLTANGVHFLNHARPVAPKNFTKLFKEFKAWIATERLDDQRICIGGSAVLAAYGLRDANDLDYLFAGEPPPVASDSEISCHNSELHHYGMAVDDLVMDPRNCFYWRGVKFLALHRVREMKVRRAEPKDGSDVYRIDTLEGTTGMVGRMLKWYYTLPERYHTLRYRMLRAVKRLIPAPLLPLARTTYRLPALLRGLAGPKEQIVIYRGFELHASRGTSLLESIRSGRIYETDVAQHLTKALLAVDTPLCLDIGANIGLHALNVLADVPTARVIAFEPGRHQADLLERTVAANHLTAQITVIRSALGNEVGTAKFSVHSTRHASGDGFFDTGRAGSTKRTDVPVTTLDQWWHDAGMPRVDAMKIDTEGAELWVLQGGEKLIASCHPLVIFELHAGNIRVYPYEATDIIRFFGRHGYIVSTLAGIEITEANVDRYLQLNNDYVAQFNIL